MALILSYHALSNHSPITLGLGVVIILLLARHLFLRLQEERIIRKFGTHAASLKSRAPFGLGFIFHSLVDNGRHALLDRWHVFFADQSRIHPYTIESRTLGTRIILTADEENIKTVLATKFNDFGKGEQFNREWHDFLGDSVYP
jgi:hypothetical protein